MASPLLGKQRPRPLRIASDVNDEASGVPRRASVVNADADLKSECTPRHIDALDLDKASFGDSQTAGTQPWTINSQQVRGHNDIPSPPSTPPTRDSWNSFTGLEPQTPVKKPVSDELILYLDDAPLLGSGLWSNVYRIENALAAPVGVSQLSIDMLTPPTTPQKSCIPTSSQVYAVKSASRSDAKEVFEEEARMLTHIQQDERSTEFVIPFYGLYNCSSALLFHCAQTTLSAYSTTFSGLSSLPSILEVYPTISTQLISGLAFLQSLHVVHADIKPDNILIDVRHSGPFARYADFSASAISPSAPDACQLSLDPSCSLPDSPASSAPVSRANSQRKPGNIGMGGGTWMFMAPEQLSSNPIINEPSYSSDVYSLGVTLLTVLMGGASPFREVADQNIFLFREAIKTGNPVGFVKNDPGLRARWKALSATEPGKKAIEGVGMALKKNKVDRIGAVGWRAWCEQ